MEFREDGIYRLPNGRELVRASRRRRGNGLFRLDGWKHFEASEYEINSDGRLLANGKLTAWDVDDLTDTGRTAEESGMSLEPGHKESNEGRRQPLAEP